jgi:hypothetical protein
MQQRFKNFVCIGSQNGHEQMLTGGNIAPGSGVRVVLVSFTWAGEGVGQGGSGQTSGVLDAVGSSWHRPPDQVS